MIPLINLHDENIDRPISTEQKTPFEGSEQRDIAFIKNKVRCLKISVRKNVVLISASSLEDRQLTSKKLTGWFGSGC